MGVSSRCCRIRRTVSTLSVGVFYKPEFAGLGVGTGLKCFQNRFSLSVSMARGQIQSHEPIDHFPVTRRL